MPVGFWAFCLAFGVFPCGRAEEAPVETWKMGSFTLHALLQPFRLSWYFDGKLLLAQRGSQTTTPGGRRSASLEFLDDGGWHALANVIGRRGGAQDAQSKDGGLIRITFEVASAGGGKAEVEVSYTPREGAPRVALALDPAQGAGKIVAVRDDLISFPGESLIVVPWSTPLGPGAPLLVSLEKNRPSPPKLGGAAGGERLLFSSRGFGLYVGAGKSEHAEVLLPDPDTIRIQASGLRLEYRIFPGKPKEVLERSALHLQEKESSGGSKEDRFLVDDWAALRRLVDSAMMAALLAQRFPRVVSIRPKEGEKEDEAQELVRRAMQAVALLPNVKLSDPAGLSGSKEAGLGQPLPLFVEFPQDPDAWRIGDEWLIGGRFLAAPVLDQGKERREIYFPEGLWTSLRKKEPPSPPIRGPARISVEVPLGESVALFEREREK